jgi:hypothetical protein
MLNGLEIKVADLWTAFSSYTYIFCRVLCLCQRHNLETVGSYKILKLKTETKIFILLQNK